jgi:hypothetical protein
MSSEQEELMYQGRPLSQWQTLLETSTAGEVGHVAEALSSIANPHHG